MGRQLLKITPMSELFFRDGITMKQGTSNWLISKAIPNLSVFYGALISLQLRKGELGDILELIKKSVQEKNKKEIQDIIDIKLREKVKIHGIYLVADRELYMPAPLDLFYNEKEKVKKGEYKNGLIYPPETEELDEVWERGDEKFIRLFHYDEKYRENNMENIKLYDSSKFFSYYHKVGLTIGDNRVNEEGNLYFADMVTFAKKDMGYILDVEWDETLSDLPEEEIIQLGGERKAALIEELRENSWEYEQWQELRKQEAQCQTDRLVKIVFTAPFLLPEGENNIISENETMVKIVASSMKKTDYIGGYNMAIEEQRKMRRAIPAGSIFLLEINEKIQGSIYDYIKKKLNQKKTDKEFVSFLVV